MPEYIYPSQRYQYLVEEIDSFSGAYIGVADPNRGTDESKWLITRVSISGCLTRILFADGVKSFTRVWDDRASLSYEVSGSA